MTKEKQKNGSTAKINPRILAGKREYSEKDEKRDE
jgi:hypothetical protein